MATKSASRGEIAGFTRWRFQGQSPPTLSRGALDANHDPFAPVIVDNQPAGGLRDGWYPYTHPFNLTGHPALTLPAGLDEDGLPIAVQFVGPWFSDPKLLAIGAWLESNAPWCPLYQTLPRDPGATESS
ncbi:MAG: amidase family protein [Pseudomonadota bacterium]